MTKAPKVSIIIPVYNVEKYMSRCLTSVVDQTLKDIEIICINDGTPDNSVAVIESYMEKDHRIILINKENQGVASARNTGLDHASGDLIMFLDPDDYLEVYACERIYTEYISEFSDVYAFGSKPFPEIPEPDEWVVWSLTCRNRKYEPFEDEALFGEPCGMPFVWNHAFSRQFLEDNQFRFEEGLYFGEDIIFLMKVMPCAKKIQFIGEQLHNYQCFRQDSLMFKYGKDERRRMIRHIKNVEVITKYWYEKGYLEKWGRSYFKWVVDFVEKDLSEYLYSDQSVLALETLKIFKKYGVDKLQKSAFIRARWQYKKIVKMAKKRV